MITSAQERMTQNGKPYGNFILEDFNDSKRFLLFSEDYLKMKHFLVEGFNVLLQVRVQLRRREKEQLEIKVVNISLLAEALEKFTKTITLHLKAESVDEELISKLKNIIRSSKGECQLKFRIEDIENRASLMMQPRNNSVDPVRFLHELRQMPQLTFKLN
jgi:DNA polymerase-3 subunit alpha